MNAESTAATDDIAPVATTAGTPGGLLRAQRELRQLSVQQAAEDLHLDVRSVEALEADNFQALGAPVYAKGHLRKYATLLGVAPDTVIALYRTLTNEPAVPTPVPVTTPSPRKRHRHRGASGLKPAIVVAVLLVIAGVWWGVKSLLSARHVQMPAIAAPAAQESGADTVAAPSSGSGSLKNGAAVERESPAPVAQVAAVRQPPAATSQDNVTMRLEFTAPSWSEIYDASGKRLMFDVGQPGQVRTVSGVAPLKVILGVAAAATVAVNERSVAVPRLPGKDATRFMVAADGSVR